MSLAVLSPYAQQVRYIRRRLRDAHLPAGITLKEPLRRRRAYSPNEEEPRPIAHTVDSFQGNEADVVIVSFVRNNTLEAWDNDALGFLKYAYRLNVLLSRAEQLLVLIGSWDFFWNQVVHVPLEDKRNQLWHWKSSLTLLNTWFETGKALKVAVQSEAPHDRSCPPQSISSVVPTRQRSAVLEVGGANAQGHWGRGWNSRRDPRHL